jgi:GNAT superfamily N-acetyltransferase
MTPGLTQDLHPGDDSIPVLSNVEPIAKNHETKSFDCGTHPSLNDWLHRYALQNQANDSARTYVVHRGSQVVGYYSITAGSIAYESATTRTAKGLAQHPVHVALLARLAVDRTLQGRRLGEALLKDALLRIEKAADILGIRAVLVHAIDENARSFYERYDFEPCPDDPLHLLLLMKDLRRILRR